MNVRRLVVFAGFDSGVIESIRRELEAQQIDPAFIKLWPTRPAEYFEKLRDRMATLAERQFANEDVRLVALLVSCISDDEELARERKVFFPMLRRLGLPAAASRDLRRAPAIAQQVISLLTDADFLATYEYVRPAADAVLALPVKNAGNARLNRELAELYALQRYKPTSGLNRYVRRLRGPNPGLRSRDIDFRGCHNGPKHPVRRVTECVQCDLNGRFRLGFSVPLRFEFDVSCEKGIAGKTFTLCSGKTRKVPAKARHVNMRINDDFDC